MRNEDVQDKRNALTEQTSIRVTTVRLEARSNLCDRVPPGEDVQDLCCDKHTTGEGQTFLSVNVTVRNG